MAGTITHEWNGTVLIITSDSGTSSMDLKGDTGQRGAQGPAGIGMPGVDGTVSFDELTEKQKASLKGEKGDRGEKGDNYIITDVDYQNIADIVLANFVDGEGVSF